MNKKIKIIQTIVLFCIISININISSFASGFGGQGQTINVDGDEYPYSVQAEGMKVPIETEQGKRLL